MPINFPDDARAQAIASIKRYLSEELEQDVGDLKAGLLLDFVLAEIGPTIHNAALADAQAFLRDRVADLEGACAVPEFAFWLSASVRRARR